MSSHKHRLDRLEKQKDRRPLGDVLMPRLIDYCADIVSGVEALADSIPVRFVEVKEAGPNEQH